MCLKTCVRAKIGTYLKKAFFNDLIIVSKKYIIVCINKHQVNMQACIKLSIPAPGGGGGNKIKG